MKTASCKAKGRTFQQYIAKRISEVVGIPYGKDEDIESRGMGQSGTDIILRGEALKKFPFSVECKRHEKISISVWMEQAKINTRIGMNWLIFFKKSRENACVVMEADVFFDLIKRANGG